MAYKIQAGETVFQIAQRFLGNGMLASQLEIPGWDKKDAHWQPPEGTVVRLPGEQPGPPAPYMLDPKRWGRR